MIERKVISESNFLLEIGIKLLKHKVMSHVIDFCNKKPLSTIQRSCIIPSPIPFAAFSIVTIKQKQRFLNIATINLNCSSFESYWFYGLKLLQVSSESDYPAGNHLFNVNNRNTTTMWNMFKVNNKDIRTTPVSLLVTLNIFHTMF